jgi:NADH dehydrogenase
MQMSKGCSQVVVVGGGFGGLQAVKTLACADVDVTLIDRNIYHLFQPLSYQVATGSLSPAEIAVPLRQIFRHEPRVRVVMGEVSGFDLKRREVLVDSTVPGSSSLMIPYDTLLVAGGSSYCYFGHERWRSLALEVKSLDSSLRVRGRILQAFEAAELERDPQLQASWLTFVVVGAGPTGVEIAGQIAELARYTLPAEFRDSDPRAGQVLLVETADRVLTALHPLLSQRASRSLQKLGVTPLLSHTLVDVRADSVELRAANGTAIRIPTRTVIWAAGVEASPLASALGELCDAELDRAGRLLVEPDLTLPGHPEVLAFGDMVRVRDPHSDQPQALPGIAPVAMQQGRYARPSHRQPPRGPPLSAVQIPQQGHAGDHRARASGRRDPRPSPQRPPGLDHLASSAPRLPGRIREPDAGAAALEPQLHHPRTRHTPDHQGHRHPANTKPTNPPRHSTRPAPLSPMTRRPARQPQWSGVLA